MSFDNVRFPTDIGIGTAIGGGFRTSIVEQDSQQEQRFGRFSQPRFVFEIAYGRREFDDLYEVMEFWLARQGALNSFRLQNPLDYTSTSNGRGSAANTDQTLGAGTGTRVDFQLTKTYTDSGANTFTRNITKPVDGTVLVAVAGSSQTENSDYTVNYSTGVITFDSGSIPTFGQAVTAGFEHDYHVRFDESSDGGLFIELPDAAPDGEFRSIRMVEVVSESAVNDEYEPGGTNDMGTVASDFTISHSDGVYQSWTDNTGVTATLYDPASENVPDGWPVQVFSNEGSSATTVNDHTDTLVVSIASNTTAILGLLRETSGDLTWKVFS